MQKWLIPCLGLLLGGCAVPASSDPGAVPLTWTGDFTGGPSNPGRITLLLDETGPTWTGTMYFESHNPGGEVPRATYRIEGAREEDGAIRIHQKEILQADPLTDGFSWCLGSYEFSLAEGDHPGLSGAYAGGAGCAGSTDLQPTDAL